MKEQLCHQLEGRSFAPTNKYQILNKGRITVYSYSILSFNSYIFTLKFLYKEILYSLSIPNFRILMTMNQSQYCSSRWGKTIRFVGPASTDISMSLRDQISETSTQKAHRWMQGLLPSRTNLSHDESFLWISLMVGSNVTWTSVYVRPSKSCLWRQWLWWVNHWPFPWWPDW